MQDDAIYQYIKLFMDYFSVWSLILLGAIFWMIRNPERLKAIPTYVASARIGNVEVQLRQIEQKLSETEAHVTELEEENARLNTLYAEFDVHAPVQALEGTRQALRSVAGNLVDISPVLEGLEPGADPADVYAAAEILRAKRDFSAFDALIAGIDRIASDPRLEGLRYHTVWTLASAAHRTILSAVKHRDRPQLSTAQLTKAKAAMQKLHDNPHVQNDRPDDPGKGIRGPVKYALNWIEQGLEKHRQLEVG